MVFKILSAMPQLLGLGRSRHRQNAIAIYEQAVAAARQPTLYADIGVPDTVDGRFDLLSLHVYLLLRRLKAAEGPDAGFGQEIFDVMFQNMDDSLREMGVGDLKVGKKVRELAEAFYGRARAYDAALDAEDRAALVDALDRNVFSTGEGMDQAAGAGALADYALAVHTALGAQELARIVRGEVHFPAPAASTNG